MKISERNDDGAEVKVRDVDGTGVVVSAEKVRSRHCDGSGESFSGGIAMTALGQALSGRNFSLSYHFSSPGVQHDGSS